MVDLIILLLCPGKKLKYWTGETETLAQLKYFILKVIILYQGCLVWGPRVVIPKNLQNKILDLLHEGHLGIVKMKQIARSVVWWPKIDQCIELTTSRCSGCLAARKSPPKVQLHPWEPAKTPWDRIHLDFATSKLGKFLICVDAFSKWPEVIPMKNTTAPQLIQVMEILFSRYGLPKKVFSDNGPEFVSDLFDTFLQKKGIKQKTSPVARPASNGLAERHIQTVKSALKKMEDEPGSLNHKLAKFLLAYRNAPHSLTNETPAQLFLGRNLRTKLTLVQPDHEEIVQLRNEKIVKNYGGVANKPFEIGQKVMSKNFAKNGKPWVHGKILAQPGTLTYIVQVGPNKYVKRHFDQLIRVHSGSELTTNDHQNDDFNIPITVSETTRTALIGSRVEAAVSDQTTNNSQNDGSSPNDNPQEGEGGSILQEPDIVERRYPIRNRNVPRHLQDYNLETDTSP